MVFVKVNDTEYPAEVRGFMNDYNWDNRESKSITLTISYEEVKTLFADGVNWSIVTKEENGVDENNQPIERIEEFDNSDYNMSGSITDNRDGTITVKMGKATELEDAYAMILGGIE